MMDLSAPVSLGSKLNSIASIAGGRAGFSVP
jgi:hypothetical protein